MTTEILRREVKEYLEEISDTLRDKKGCWDINVDWCDEDDHEVVDKFDCVVISYWCKQCPTCCHCNKAAFVRLLDAIVKHENQIEGLLSRHPEWLQEKEKRLKINRLSWRWAVSSLYSL